MKNNDFDFIKNKFDRAEPEMPEGMNKDVLKQRILSKDKHRVIKFKQKKSYFKPIAAAAACFMLILGVAAAVNYDIINSDRPAVFDSYADVNKKITELEKSAAPYGGLGCGIFGTSLERREEGYAKPEMLITDSSYIYLAHYDVDNNINRNKVYIYKAEEGTEKPVSVIEHMAPDSTDEYSDSYAIRGLFVNNNRLAAVLEKSNPVLNELQKRDFGTAIIQIYDISDISNPKKITEYAQSGEYAQARMANGILYTATHYDVTSDDKNYTIPRISNGNTIIYASSKNISCFEDVKASQYAVISAIDLSGGEMADDLKAVLGGSANIRCSGKYMYINEYINGERWGEPERKVETAIKLNLENGKFYHADEKEVAENSYDTVKINRGNMFDGRLYPFGNYFIAFGSDMDNGHEEMILFDRDINELDSIKFKNMDFEVDFYSPYFNEKANAIVMPAYNDNGCLGVVTFEIKSNKISVKEKSFDSETEDMLPYPQTSRLFSKSSIIVNGTLYKFVFGYPETGMKCHAYKY